MEPIAGSRRVWASAWLWAAVLAAVALVGALVARKGGAAGASALSASPDGLLAARIYLERRGSRVSLADAPPENLASGDALILAFPASTFLPGEEMNAARRGLAAGSTVIFAYSGRTGMLEELLAGGFGLSIVPARGHPPLGPRRWWAYAKADWRLRPEPAFGAGAREVVVRAPDRVPQAPDDAVVLYRGEGGTPAVFVIARGHGRLVVLPADALSNGRLGSAGNASLLESLRSANSGRITFAEYHHGLVSPGARADDGSAHSLDLLLAELLLLYGLAAFALSRRFGPSWEEPPEISGSASAFLFGLGALHRRLRHSSAASARLVEAAVRLDPRVRVPPPLLAAARAAGGGESEFLELAKTVARSQRRWRSL